MHSIIVPGWAITTISLYRGPGKQIEKSTLRIIFVSSFQRHPRKNAPFICADYAEHHISIEQFLSIPKKKGAGVLKSKVVINKCLRKISFFEHLGGWGQYASLENCLKWDFKLKLRVGIRRRWACSKNCGFWVGPIKRIPKGLIPPWNIPYRICN